MYAPAILVLPRSLLKKLIVLNHPPLTAFSSFDTYVLGNDRLYIFIVLIAFVLAVSSSNLNLVSDGSFLMAFSCQYLCLLQCFTRCCLNRYDVVSLAILL